MENSSLRNGSPGNEGKETLKRKVLIIDDHAILQQGLALLINREADFIVCGVRGDALAGLEAVEALSPDIVITDISLPGMGGIEFIKCAKARHTALPIVVLSMHDESLYAERALRAGALGYVMKSADVREITEAMRKALNGEWYVSGRVNGALLQRFLGVKRERNDSPVAALSDRELEVFEMLGYGKTTREIAMALNLSVKTIDSHRMHIKEKLAIRTAPELVRRAVHYVQYEAGLGAAGTRDTGSPPSL